MLSSQLPNQTLTLAQESHQMVIGILVLLLVVALTLFIGHLVMAGPERQMDAAVKRHVTELNSQYARLFQPEPPTCQRPAKEEKTTYL